MAARKPAGSPIQIAAMKTITSPRASYTIPLSIAARSVGGTGHGPCCDQAGDHPARWNNWLPPWRAADFGRVRCSVHSVVVRAAEAQRMPSRTDPLNREAGWVLGSPVWAFGRPTFFS